MSSREIERRGNVAIVQRGGNKAVIEKLQRRPKPRPEEDLRDREKKNNTTPPPNKTQKNKNQNTNGLKKKAELYVKGIKKRGNSRGKDSCSGEEPREKMGSKPKRDLGVA